MALEEFDIEFLAQKMSENPRSPLFARLADLYLIKEQSAEAMKLLEEGIPNFPNYCSSYIVLGKAHLAFKEYSKAYTAFSKALELSPFNQTAAHLLTTVPNKPDESTRTTDETYFALPAASVPQPVTESVPVQEQSYSAPVEPEPLPQATFETPAAEEFAFTQPAEEQYGTMSSQPEVQMHEVPSEIQSTYSTDSFPTYDEYFTQNQSRIATDTPIKLDDYLSGNIPETEPEVPAELRQHEFVNDAYVEPESPMQSTFESPAEPAVLEEHAEPEPVFSSPEQAQLFAELTGTAAPESESRQSSTDLDSLTEMLQSAEKIVPEENYQPKTPPPKESHDEQAYETDAVTPTLAEIYASQGEYRAAIQAYEILMFSQPAKGGEFQQRIRELQQKQMEKDGLI